MNSQYYDAAPPSHERLLQKKKLPDSPGVYFFLGRNGKTLYIGRATSLRDRVRSYFRGDILKSRGPWIAKMLHLVKAIDFRKTDSVLEAILLEAKLIKKFQPPYNTDEKDDKSFNCVVITKEKFPAVFIVRKTDIDFSSSRISAKGGSALGGKDKGLGILAIFGPFPDGRQLKTALKIIRRIFPFRDSCAPITTHLRHTNKLENVGVSRACFNRQIGLCPGVCTGEISKKDYAKIMRNIRLLFEGKKPRLLRLLKREMKEAAKAQKFERAGELKKQLFALAHIQDVALLNREVETSRLPSTLFRGGIKGGVYRIEAYDLSHFGGKEIVGAMAVVKDGAAKRNEYRLFRLRTVATQNEAAGLREILRRRFNHPEWKSPNLIVVDGNEVQRKVAEAVLKQLKKTIPVVAVVKDDKHNAREIIGLADIYPRSSAFAYLRESAVLLANSEAHRFALEFHRRRLRRY